MTTGLLLTPVPVYAVFGFVCRWVLNFLSQGRIVQGESRRYRTRWQMERAYADRLISSATVREVLSPVGDILPVANASPANYYSDTEQLNTYEFPVV